MFVAIKETVDVTESTHQFDQDDSVYVVSSGVVKEGGNRIEVLAGKAHVCLMDAKYKECMEQYPPVGFPLWQKWYAVILGMYRYLAVLKVRKDVE